MNYYDFAEKKRRPVRPTVLFNADFRRQFQGEFTENRQDRKTVVERDI